MVKTIEVPIQNNPIKQRHFCTVFNGAYLIHKDNCNPPSTYLEVYHNNKQVIAGLDWGIQSSGNRNSIYNNIEKNLNYDIEINDEIFLFHDYAGCNYIHFFFNHLSRLVYFEELRKTNPNLKLGIISDYYNNVGGKWSFIKEWLDLYYENENIEIIVFEKDKTYLIKQLTISNCFYGFPEPHGYDPMINMIKKVVDKIQPIEVKANGCYISRQDTIKLGWYHKREMENELELIEKIKSELDYDIIEMMNYTIKEKIQLSKSYKNIIQQSSASNINILFTKPGTNNIILSNPKMGPWLNQKCNDFAAKSGSTLLIINDIGELIIDPNESPLSDQNNYPWRITDIDGVVDLLKRIDDGSIWES
jgi:hypothetical protein